MGHCPLELTSEQDNVTKSMHSEARKAVKIVARKATAGRSAYVMDPECLALLENFRLIDDTFMSKCLEKAPECIERAHLRHSPPSLLMIGNNYLKQLAIGARANSPAPICRSSNCHDSECSRCARRKMLFLKVVLVVSKSQCAWVKNGDDPCP